jgi:hypothetical protein
VRTLGTAEAKPKLPVAKIAADLLRVYRRHWVLLVLGAIVILLPQAVIDAVLGDLEVAGLHSAKDVVTLVAVPLTVVVSLLGQALYAGFAAAAVVEWRAGRPMPSFRSLVRSLPIRRLIAVDVLLGIGAAIGLLLLIVPGLIFLAYFSIAPALIKIEHLSVWASLKRCVQLVRGQFWRVFVVVVGAIGFTEIAMQVITLPFHGFRAAVVADLIAEGLLEPFEGLVIVLTALALLDLRGETPPPEQLMIAPASPQ